MRYVSRYVPVKEYPYPGGDSPHDTNGYGKINVPVRLQSEDQEATISPGDYLIGDLNGVVCLPKGLVGRAVALMASQVEADGKIAKDIQNGRTFQEASKEHRAKVKRVEDL